MSTSLTLACVWVVAATALAMMPGRWHWRAAYVLIALGIPLLGWITYENGPVWGVIALAGGMSMLRWPVIFTYRWLRRKMGAVE